MPITLGDFNITPPARDGKVATTLGLFTTSFTGTFVTTATASAPQQITGAFVRGMESFRASFGEGLEYPRLGTLRHNSRVYAEDNFDGEWDRQHIAGHDAVMLGMFINGQWDQGSAGDYPGDPGGTNGYLSRDAVYNDLWTRNPNLVIYEYTNVMEGGVNGQKADFIATMIGPDNSDGWIYEPQAFAQQDFSETYRHSTWPGSFSINITSYAVGPPPENLTFAEWMAGYIKAGMMDKNVSNPDKQVHMFQDVMLLKPKESGSDMDGDQQSDSSDDFWDPEDEVHMVGPLNSASAPTQEYGHAVQLAREWREGQAEYAQAIKDRNPGILVTGENPKWYREWATTDINDAPVLMTEYQDLIHGGFLTNQTTDAGGWPRSGMWNNGQRSTNRNPNVGFQKAYNSYWYAIENTLPPNHVFNDWGSELEPFRDPRHPSPAGNAIETSEPTGGAWNCVRTGMVMALMNIGFISIVGQPGSNGNSSPWFDEFGLHNLSTTGLSGSKWLGKAIDPPQTEPRAGGWWARKFQNGWAVGNPSQTTPLVIDMALFGGAGMVRRINGVQDPVTNNGQVVNSLTIPELDAIILEII